MESQEVENNAVEQPPTSEATLTPVSNVVTNGVASVSGGGNDDEMLVESQESSNHPEQTEQIVSSAEPPEEVLKKPNENVTEFFADAHSENQSPVCIIFRFKIRKKIC
jgi:hypothetical protein